MWTVSSFIWRTLLRRLYLNEYHVLNPYVNRLTDEIYLKERAYFEHWGILHPVLPTDLIEFKMSMGDLEVESEDP